MSRFAPISEVATYVSRLVRDPHQAAVVLDAQINLFERWQSIPECWQRTVVTNQHREILGTICACPEANHVRGLACGLARVECSVAQKWDRDAVRQDGHSDRQTDGIELQDLAFATN